MNRTTNISFLPPHRQRGAVLVISLIMLLIMTILAISISQTGTLEERMAGNARDQEAAFQGAESGLRAGESALGAVAGTIIACPTVANCISRPRYSYSGIDLSAQNATWWSNNGVEYGAAGTRDITKLVQDPRYAIVERGEYSDSYGIGSAGGGSATYVFYEVTSRSLGVTDTAEAITQSIFARAK